jgi:hypothetical protein
MRALATIGWIALAALTILVRQQGVPAWDTVWAEDGSLFLRDALRDPLGAVLHPYTGYIHLAPRIVAAVSAALPLDLAALSLAVGSALVVAVLSLYVFWASRGVITSLPARAVVAGSMILLPAAGYESANNATNLRWYLLYACFWSLIRESRTTWQAGADATVAAVAALSDPFTVLLVPLAWWSLRDRGRLDRTVWAAFGGALVVQLSVVLHEFVIADGPPLQNGEFVWAQALGLLGMRVATTFAMGDRAVQMLWPFLGWWMGWLGLALLAMTTLYAVSRTSTRNRGMVLYTIGLACAVFLVSLFLRGTEMISPDGDVLVAVGLRWTVTPILFLTAAWVMLLDEPDTRVRRTTWRRLVIGIGGLLVVVWVWNFPVWSFRSMGPSWTEELRLARGRCFSGGPVATVPISPIRPEGLWKVRLPCGTVTDQDVVAAVRIPVR